MIRKYNEYIKEVYSIEKSYNEDYIKNSKELEEKLKKLIDNGTIILGEGKSLKDILGVFDLGDKYNRFGFEKLMIDLSKSNNKNPFISSSDSQNMETYVNNIKDIGIDTTKLDNLLPEYIKYFKLLLNGEDDISNNSYSKEERVEKYNELNNKLDRLNIYHDNFIEELKKVSKKVTKLL